MSTMLRIQHIRRQRRLTGTDTDPLPEPVVD